MLSYSWDRAKADEYHMPLVDDVAYRTLAKKLGGGSLSCGKWIIKQIIAHVDHADKAHPWLKDQKIHIGMNHAEAEVEEVKEQLVIALEAGLEDPEGFFVDDEFLEESTDHFFYEIGDTIAVFVKLLRIAYGREDA